MDDVQRLSKDRLKIIAEIGINHCGSIVIAAKMIELAAKCGVHCVKFQTYRTETRVASDDPLFGLLKRCELPYDAFGHLKAIADECNVEFISTPFDADAVDVLERIGCTTIKIASFDVSNTALLRKIAMTDMSVVMSVGMATLSEIKRAYGIIKRHDRVVTIMHCVSSYPMQSHSARLSNIAVLYNEFPYARIGYSDHEKGIEAASCAVAMGVTAIEKHFLPIDIAVPFDAPDACVSICCDEFKALIDASCKIVSLLGTPLFGVRDVEQQTMRYRRIT